MCCLLISEIEEGSSICISEEQFLKPDSPISVTDDRTFISVNEEHSSNAPFSIVVTESWIYIFANEEHRQNAFDLIDATLIEIVNYVSEVQFSNKLFSIESICP